MKLYTEEDVLKMLRSFHNVEMNVQFLMLKLTPIELPSDKVIESKSYEFWNFNENTSSTAWKLGAKWMKEQLKLKI